MIEGLLFIEESYQIGLDIFLTIMAFAVSLLFGVKGVENFLFSLLAFMGLLSVGFYTWTLNGWGDFDYSLPLKIFILGIIMLSLSLYKRTSSGVI